MSLKDITEEDYQNVVRKGIQNLFRAYIVPEIKRRQEQGSLPTPFGIKKAQVIFHPDRSQPEVRVNEEVTAELKVKLKDGGEKKPGETVRRDDIEEVWGVALPQTDDLINCAHMTLANVVGTWFGSFDFTYYRGYSRQHVDTARQFLDSARMAREQQLWAPFVDNLFSCAELLAKARLITLGDQRLVEKATHRAIDRRFNRFARLGNVPGNQRDVFNKLRKLRPKLRYLQDEEKLTVEEADRMLATVSHMFEDVSRRVR